MSYASDVVLGRSFDGTFEDPSNMLRIVSVDADVFPTKRILFGPKQDSNPLDAMLRNKLKHQLIFQGFRLLNFKF